MGRLPIDIKKKLGQIIRTERLIRYENHKSQNATKENPYSKENFCKGVCHYHTLNKLEKDFINDSQVYYQLLDKLGYTYNVSYNEHRLLMDTLNTQLYRLLHAMEYIDDDLLRNIMQDLSGLNVQEDCIVYFHVKLMEIANNFQIFKSVNEYELKRIIELRDLYDGVYKGLYYHILGLYYMNNLNLTVAEEHLLQAKNIYHSYNISKGLINTNFISLYMLKKDYVNMVNLCVEMEDHYLETSNNNRLLHVYSSLAEHFLYINALEKAYYYHNKRKELLDREPLLSRFRFSIFYNWGMSLIYIFKYQEAYDYIYQAYQECPFEFMKLRIINPLLFLMTNLKIDEHLVKEVIEEGKRYYDKAIETDQTVFKYFEFRYSNNQYYRKYGLQKIVPLLLEDPERINFAIMLFEDLYD